MAPKTAVQRAHECSKRGRFCRPLLTAGRAPTSSQTQSPAAVAAAPHKNRALALTGKTFSAVGKREMWGKQSYTYNLTSNPSTHTPLISTVATILHWAGPWIFSYRPSPPAACEVCHVNCLAQLGHKGGPWGALHRSSREKRMEERMEERECGRIKDIER